MLSKKSLGTLKMPTVYGIKSIFEKLLRKMALHIIAAGVIVIGIAAALLTPVFMRLDGRYPFFAGPTNTFTGTRKNGEPAKAQYLTEEITVKHLKNILAASGTAKRTDRLK
ncbi:MAG: hypothetical protein K2J77_00630 [Oscillospiraceae bacterium]|nr:hypothetical protein [Oscillospiraceae bacterium]